MSTATEIRDAEVKKFRNQLTLDTLVSPGKSQVQADRLFDDILLETSDLQRHRRTFSAALSFVIQCLLLGVLLVVPLMFTEALPQGQLLTFLMAPPPPPPPPPPPLSLRPRS